MGVSTPTHAEEAQRLKSAFQGLYFTGGYITPIGYSWVNNQPSPYYPDSGNEMFDTWTGNPNNFSDGWVGFPGVPAAVFINLGLTEKTFNWVAFHVLNYFGAAIKFPDYLKLFCWPDEGDWQYLGTWARPTGVEAGAGEDSEYVFSNSTPLNASCKYVYGTLYNNSNPHLYWTFVSEIEIVR